MDTPDIAQDMKRSIMVTSKWLSKRGFEGASGTIYHSVFFSDKQQSEKVLRALSHHGYRDTYSDELENDPFPYWIDFAKELKMTEVGLRQELLEIQLQLQPYNYDYNSFTILVDLEDDVESTAFFDPNEESIG